VGLSDEALNRTTGCNARLLDEASDRVIYDATAFIKACRVKYMGPFGMPGISCKSDADCFEAACDVGIHKCNHTEDMVVKVPRPLSLVVFVFPFL